jgi:hypothetical protein
MMFCMKKIQTCFILIVLCCAFASCYKDKGNYDYKPVNELNFTNIDTAKGYTVTFGEMLKVSPQLKGTQDPDGSGKQYSYEWSLDFSEKDSVLSTQKNLDVKLLVPPGKYTLQFKATDLETGIRFHIRTQLLVTTNVFEGYLVMNEVNGKTRLDMLSYYRTDDRFEQLTDVLSQKSSTAPVQGKPKQVFCMETETFNITPQTYRIYLVTEASTYKIDPETFGYTTLDDIRYETVGSLPANFKPGNLTGSLQYLFMPVQFMTAGNNIYRRMYQGVSFPYVPINIYAGQSQPFKAFPQLVCYDDGFTIFNMDTRTFTFGTGNNVNVEDIPPGNGFPEGKDMVYMEDQPSTGLGYALMKDPGIANYYLMRFYPGYAFSDYFEPVNAVDIDKATHFTSSPELGYFFYSVGGKLYEYDPFLQQSFLMLDKGNQEITYIAFQKFFNPNLYDKYTKFGNLLTVGTLNPSGSEGSNGTLEQYAVPPVNAPLQKKNSWTGFGKITSVAYRERN